MFASYLKVASILKYAYGNAMRCKYSEKSTAYSNKIQVFKHRIELRINVSNVKLITQI